MSDARQPDRDRDMGMNDSTDLTFSLGDNPHPAFMGYGGGPHPDRA